MAFLDRVPVSQQNANFHLFRAALVLDVGRVDEACANIDKALAKDPKAGLAHVLRSIIEVVENQAASTCQCQESGCLVNRQPPRLPCRMHYKPIFVSKQLRDTLLSA